MVSVQNKIVRQWLKAAAAAIPMIAVMAAIFALSHQAGTESAETSSGVAEWIVGLLGMEVPPGMSASDVPIVCGLNIRKLAHVFLYMLLGGTSFLFVAMLPFKASAFVRPAICAGGAAVISFLYACSDELHQSFVAGRDGKFADVGVDAIGFLTVSILILAVWYLVLLWKHRHSADISPHVK